MLEYESARKLYDEIKEKAAEVSDPEFDEFFEDYLKLAVEYAQIRASWKFMNYEEKMRNDDLRSATHTSYIKMLEAVCRNLGITELDKMVPDRKTKGNFACYVSLFLAMEQR